ncbi:HET-domain-containing protein [Lophium mytilinum]|uniref:HET-domain-containing protein n=1 Tax=Lophium mytilinum TaxID=390894 RepID=A0A6A6QAX1_9PEZI|nr:HET-domain-containing protein [Lophium mytilinum]
MGDGAKRETCHHLEFGQEYSNTALSRTIKLASLKQTASQGCTACAAIQGALDTYPEPIGMREIRSLRSSSKTVGGPLILEPTGYTSPGEDPLYVKNLELFIRPGDQLVWPAIGYERDVSEDSSSPEALALAQGWLKDCLSGHPACPAYVESSLPTRVLQVGSDTMNPRLHVTNGALGKYAALSYCWGPPPHHWKTTPSTLEDRTTSISLTELPKTLRDAVIITRELGIPYLWIDALCIIQDSEDWASEAGKMGEYYSNDVVTISADGSTDSHTGCFVRGNRRFSSAVPVVFEGKDSAIRVRTCSAWPLDGAHPPMAKRDGGKITLNTRGWTLQEQILSPRILHFSAYEAVWECASAMPCECKLVPDKPLPMRLKNRLIIENTIPRSAIKDNTPNERKGLILRWNQVIYDYTQRDLTHATDRLPAVSGLAAVMQTRSTGDEYVVGLWKEGLAMWLCWQALTPPGTGLTARAKPPSKRLEKYCAPSWSWASVSSVVEMSLQDREILYEGAKDSPIEIKLNVLSISCTLAGLNPFGNVSAAELHCKGTVVPVVLQQTNATRQLYVVSERAAESRKPTALVYRDTYEENGEIEIGKRYFLLVVISHRPARNDPQYRSLVYGLLLRKQSLEKYYRVALVVGYPNDAIGRYFTEDWEAVGEMMELILV